MRTQKGAEGTSKSEWYLISTIWVVHWSNPNYP